MGRRFYTNKMLRKWINWLQIRLIAGLWKYYRPRGFLPPAELLWRLHDSQLFIVVRYVSEYLSRTKRPLGCTSLQALLFLAQQELIVALILQTSTLKENKKTKKPRIGAERETSSSSVSGSLQSDSGSQKKSPVCHTFLFLKNCKRTNKKMDEKNPKTRGVCKLWKITSQFCCKISYKKKKRNKNLCVTVLQNPKLDLSYFKNHMLSL